MSVSPTRSPHNTPSLVSSQSIPPSLALTGIEPHTHLVQTQESEPIPGNTDEPFPLERPNNDLCWPIALRKGVRSCTLYPISRFVSYEGVSHKFCAFITELTTTEIPNNIYEALKQPRWRAIVEEEIQALEKNGTWELSELPRGMRLVGCRWIFTIKHKADGSIDEFKTRLVAKGFTQSYGIDYQETFAIVPKLNTI